LRSAVLAAFQEGLNPGKRLQEPGARAELKRRTCRYHYQKEAKIACTKVQVFHRWYREKEAKTVAKVEIGLTYFFSAA
jgi:hypothetical protein